jgi:hypothetical protein
MSKNILLINTASDSFQDFYERVNDLISFVKDEAVSVNTSVGISKGNGFVNGTFGAINLYAQNLRGGNTTASANLTISSNVNTTGSMNIAGNLTVSGNVSFPNFSLSLSFPPTNGAALGNSSLRWTLYSLNIYNQQNISTNTISVQSSATIGGIVANTSGYFGTADNATKLNGQFSSFYTNATNLSTGTVQQARLPVATTTTYGITTLVHSIDSAATDKAATPGSVKVAYDAAVNAYNAAGGAQSTATSAYNLAAAAQSAAGTAQSTASQAQSTASGAQSTASGAQSTAGSAYNLAQAAYNLATTKADSSWVSTKADSSWVSQKADWTAVVQNFVSSIRLGSGVNISSGQEQSGYVAVKLTATPYTNITYGFYVRPLQMLINGNWYTVSTT